MFNICVVEIYKDRSHARTQFDILTNGGMLLTMHCRLSLKLSQEAKHARSGIQRRNELFHTDEVDRIWRPAVDSLWQRQQTWQNLIETQPVFTQAVIDEKENRRNMWYACVNATRTTSRCSGSYETLINESLGLPKWSQSLYPQGFQSSLGHQMVQRHQPVRRLLPVPPIPHLYIQMMMNLKVQRHRSAQHKIADEYCNHVFRGPAAAAVAAAARLLKMFRIVQTIIKRFFSEPPVPI